MRESPNQNPLQYFDAVLKTNNRNIEALFGKAKYFTLCGHYEEANELVRNSVVTKCLSPLCLKKYLTDKFNTKMCEIKQWKTKMS